MGGVYRHFPRQGFSRYVLKAKKVLSVKERLDRAFQRLRDSLSHGKGSTEGNFVGSSPMLRDYTPEIVLPIGSSPAPRSPPPGAGLFLDGDL